MEVLNYRQIDKGCVRARFDVRVPAWGLTLKELTLFEKDGRKWLGLPSRQYQGKDGVVKHFPQAEFDKPVRARFETAVIEKINAKQVQFAAPKGQAMPEPKNQDLPF